MTVPFYRAIAQALCARDNSLANNNTEWLTRWNAVLREYDKMLPRGSGLDNGSVLVHSLSDGEVLTFETSFHHMHDSGIYDGWTEHRVVVKPSLLYGITIGVSGRDHRDIKTHIAEVFTEALLVEVDEKDVMTKVLAAEEQRGASLYFSLSATPG